VRKILVFLTVLSVFVGLSGFVIGDPQTVNGEVPGFVMASLTTTSVNYGSVTPGSNSVTQANVIHVNEETNTDVKVEISLDGSSNTLFQNLYFDVDKLGTYEIGEQITSVPFLTYTITDQAGAFDDTVNSILKVPAGYSPTGGSVSGTVIYTLTDATP
jgi:hypothetical protein